MTNTLPEQVIANLEAHSGRLDKEEIIKKQAVENNVEFFDGVRMSLDDLITFGVKKVPTHSGPDGQGLPWAAFKELANLLYTRQLTGHDARDAIELALTAATQLQWNNWYRRILIKDLRCGINDKTVNKVLKEFKNIKPVPVFECMLAHDGANHESKIAGKKLLEPKLDGCLSEDWIVEFENGSKIKIKEVVDQQIKGKVKSFNTITGKIEFNQITGWAVDGIDDSLTHYDWFEITLENGITLPPLTGNHLIYLPLLKCYRRVDLLTEHDIILCDI